MISRDICDRLLQHLLSESEFPVWIGPDHTGIACTDAGESFRIKGKTGKFFPSDEVQKKLNCTENELMAAISWVTGGEPELMSFEPGAFWFFLPKNMNKWPKE